MTEEETKSIIGVLFAIISIVLICYFIIRDAEKYYLEHPCLEWKTYCYYEDNDLSVGIGPVIGGNGGMSMAVVPTSTKVYVNCDTKDVPKEIQKEQVCELRK